MIINYTGQQGFCPIDVFLDDEIKYVPRISLSPTHFALHKIMRTQQPTYMSQWGPLGGCVDM
jgi:hypothetical protein